MTTSPLVSAATRFVPVGLQALAVQPRTHQVLAAGVALAAIGGAIVAAQPTLTRALGAGNALPLVGLAMLLVSALALVSQYLKRYERPLVGSARHLYLLASVSGGTLLLAWAFLGLGLNPYLSPLTACGMLLGVFVNRRVAVLVTTLLGLLLALLPGFTASATLVGLGAALVAIHAAQRVQQRFDLARAGLMAGLAGAWIVASLGCLDGKAWPVWGLAAVSAVLAGIFNSVLVVGLLPYLEDVFGITTTFKLLELASPNQPLLKELQLKAPGTYHHSIMVGNLAEAAAEAIGADALLVRVGAYYHDIGKTKRPYFFVENQLGMANQHDRISPRLSALVITAHVKEGLEMAREHKLPGIIQEFIATHHGTSLVSYFYHQAVQAEGAGQVMEEHFRYPGPRPRTRETGILMLADGVEAACRSIKHPTAEAIEAMVRKIVDKRLSDGELSEAPLTLSEIEKLAQTFVRILTGLYHQRIEYPDQVFKELRGEASAPETKGKKLGALPK